VKLPAFVAPDALAAMREEFEGFVRHLDDELALGRARYQHYDEEEHLWVDERAYVTNNAFKHSRALTAFAADEAIVGAAQLYIGAQPVIQRALGMRYLAGTVPETNMFGWHHDMDEKRCKVMVLLTDVGPDDQCMSYVVGSHTLFHPYDMFLSNPCPLDYLRASMPDLTIYDAHGSAGDVFLFDTNGAHRGNRRDPAPTRDVFLIEYSADLSNVWGGDVDADVLGTLPGGASRVFEPLLGATKRWTKPLTRRVPHWVSTLPEIGSWFEPAPPGSPVGGR
jgi:hypothetical protein